MLAKSESGKVPFLTKSGFLMTYKATIRAGFDISKTGIDITDERITVTLPEMEVQEVTIDPDSLEFYNTTLTIFKPDGKEETKSAMKNAEKDAMSHVKGSGLLEAASENAESLIKGLFADAAGDRDIVVKQK